MSADFLTTSIALAHQNRTGSPISPTKDGADVTLCPLPLISNSNFEAQSDYYGLPSKPVSVYHMGVAWQRPTGPEAQCVPKEARPICKHVIADVWDELGPQILDYLDSVNIYWTTIDITHFAKVEKDPGPVFHWVGMKPRSLSCESAKVVAVDCKSLLKDFVITNVKVTDAPEPEACMYISASGSLIGPMLECEQEVPHLKAWATSLTPPE